jgi:hypothetical protein
MRDITLFDKDGNYFGSIRTTEGKEQPQHVSCDNRLFEQTPWDKKVYKEIESNNIEKCFVVPAQYYKTMLRL